MESNNQKGIQKTIYLDKEALGVMSGIMVEEKQSLSETINQILRDALSLNTGGKIRTFIDGGSKNEKSQSC